MIREKQIRSGNLLEADFYPVSCDGRRLPRGEKKRPSSEEMKKYNKLIATKKVIRLVNTNFGSKDVFMTLTYPSGHMPQDEKEARKDIVNFLRRVKTYRAAQSKKLRAMLGIDPKNAELNEQLRQVNAPLRYLYVMEKSIYKTGIHKGQPNIHFHLFISGSGRDDRDKYEELWHYKSNTRRFRPEKFGPDAAAKYICKDPQGSKRFVCSRSLKKPAEKIKDGKLTPRKVELMATSHIDDAAYWERRYKGYSFLRCYSRYNEFNGNWYVSAIMYKYGDEPPLWTIKEWMT